MARRRATETNTSTPAGKANAGDGHRPNGRAPRRLLASRGRALRRSGARAFPSDSVVATDHPARGRPRAPASGRGGAGLVVCRPCAHPTGAMLPVEIAVVLGAITAAFLPRWRMLILRILANRPRFNTFGSASATTKEVIPPRSWGLQLRSAIRHTAVDHLKWGILGVPFTGAVDTPPRPIPDLARGLAIEQSTR